MLPPAPRRPASVSAETVTALRDAIRRHLTSEVHDGDLRAALQRLTREARANRLHAEQVIIILKSVWADLPEASQPAPGERRGTLERLVTFCINEYYGEG
jgi:hypothetical protein